MFPYNFCLDEHYINHPFVHSIFQIYINEKLATCPQVKTGDRLALQFMNDDESIGSVAYKFNDEHPTSLAEKFNVSDPLSIGDVIEFSKLTFPYSFSVAAYIDTGECSKFIFFWILHYFILCSFLTTFYLFLALFLILVHSRVCFQKLQQLL